MKTKRFFILLFLFSFFLIEQNSAQELRCGTPEPTSRQREEMLKKLWENASNRNQGDCTDPTWGGGNQTYRLILEYCETFTCPDAMGYLAGQINNYYSHYGITFEITIKKSACTDCDDYFDPGWGFNVDNTSPYTNCIYGRIVNNSTPELNGLGNIGRFWAKFTYNTNNIPHGNYYTSIHEIGHTLGLFHTFDGYIPLNPAANENIQETSTCPCNCLEKADQICDTPATPYFLYSNNNENNNMFYQPQVGAESIINTDGILDICGTNYTILNNFPSKLYMMYHNIMSYFNRNDRVFSQGQVDRMKILNQNSPWNVGEGTIGYIACPAQPVLVPTTISTDKYYTEDMEVSSVLEIKNCTVKFAPGKKLILKQGGKLNMDNATLSSYEGNECLYNTTAFWEGVKVGGNSVKISMKNNSKIEKVESIGIQSSPGNTGAPFNFIVEINSGSIVHCPSKTAIDIYGGRSYVLTNNATINGKINIDKGGSLLSQKTTFNGDLVIFTTDIILSEGCTVNENLLIQHQFIDQTRISDSKFYGNVYISNVAGSIIIRGNEFHQVGTNTADIRSMRLSSVSDFDVVENKFYNFTSNAFFIDGILNNNANLLFKNEFYSCNTAINVKSNNDNLALECNTLNGTTSRDIKIGIEPGTNLASIASKQGDDRLAAGNDFSRVNIEIDYQTSAKVNEYWYRKIANEEPIYIIDPQAKSFFTKENTNLNTNGSKCSLPYPQPPTYSVHCSNGIKDGDETGIDCGGSCIKCDPINNTDHTLALCNNGIKDQGETEVDCGGYCMPCFSCNNGMKDPGETGVDCGGLYCPPCNVSTCNDGILNNGEVTIDCGGPCPPCVTPPPASCVNGIQDSGETSVDCGGPCTLCSHCTDGILNYGETGLDCGGECGQCGVIGTEVFNCYDGIQNGTETGVDCGGACHPCGGYDGNPPTNQDYTSFVSVLGAIYGASYIPSGNTISITGNITSQNLSMDGGSTTNMINLIHNYSSTQPEYVINTLVSASPYVSVTTIHTLFANCTSYTEAQVAQILSLNPGLASDPYVDYVVNNSASFTSAVATSIKTAQISTDQRTLSNENIRIKRHYMHHLMRRSVSVALEDVAPDYEYIRRQIAKKDDANKIYQIYEAYLSEDRYRDADAYIQSIVPSSITDPYYKNQLEAFLALHKALIKYYYGGNKNIALPENVKNGLISIANGCNGYASVKARSVLRDLFEMSFADYVSCNLYPTLIFKQEINPRRQSKGDFTIMPNPVSGILEILNHNDPNDNKYEVYIHDMIGKQVYTVRLSEHVTRIDVSKWSSGIYTYNISSQGKMKSNGKFIKID